MDVKQHTDDGVHLLYQAVLCVWVVFEQHQHEEKADGESIRSGDHHLQHTLPHVVAREFPLVLFSSIRLGQCSSFFFFLNDIIGASEKP